PGRRIDGVRGVVDRECRRGRGSDREQQRGYAEKEAANGSHGGGRRRMPGTRAAVKTVREEGGCLQLRRRLRRRISDDSRAASWQRGGRGGRWAREWEAREVAADEFRGALGYSQCIADIASPVVVDVADLRVTEGR